MPITRERQSWRKPESNMAHSQKIFRDKIFDDPRMRMALGHYINSLDLQGQINKNGLSETDASKLFDHAVQNFMRNVHTKITARINPPPSDLNDLTIPINMENALNNPDSWISIQMDELIAVLTSELDMQATQIKQVEQEESDQMQRQPRSNTEDDLEKGAVVVTALKSLEDDSPEVSAGKMAAAFEACTGNKVDFKNLDDENNEQSLFKAPSPKPQYNEKPENEE